ncbi:MAG TPA: hypothetical protein VFC85_02425 [Verrucomicrobiae bacterium]|nr:hypothetical protein [Verrucomicrobiae bacterium]
MIANFFQSLDRNGVEYLLISGQATVLYGAATFSEDIDLWINPTEKNRDRFLLALRDCRARYYKLTPPLTVENLQRGHGFHFILPGGDNDEIFLDVMGNPPRAGSFADALETARWMETEWGKIHIIGIKSLVELKKTQRLEDYPIISKLALAWFDQPECKKTADDFFWALQNIFTLPELTIFFNDHPAAVDIAVEKLNPEVGEFGRQLLGGEAGEAIERRVGEFFQSQISKMQLADRQYWREIIRELKELRAADKLMVEGENVSVFSMQTK